MTGKSTGVDVPPRLKRGRSMLRHYKAIGGGEMFVARGDDQRKSGPETSGPPGLVGRFFLS